MAEKSKKLKLKIQSYYNYIQIFNGYLNLTHQEIRVLSEFCRIYCSYIDGGETEFTPNVFSRDVKAQVSRKLGYTSPDSLNNYIKAFKDKGAIKPMQNSDTTGYYIIPMLVPGNEDQIVFTLDKPEQSKLK